MYLLAPQAFQYRERCLLHVEYAGYQPEVMALFVRVNATLSTF